MENIIGLHIIANLKRIGKIIMIKNLFAVLVLSSAAFAGSPVQQGNCPNGQCFKNAVGQSFQVVENVVVGTTSVAVATIQKVESAVCPATKCSEKNVCSPQVYYRKGLFRRR